MAHCDRHKCSGDVDPTVRSLWESFMLPVPLLMTSEGENLDAGFLDFLCNKYLNSFLAAELYP